MDKFSTIFIIQSNQKFWEMIISDKGISVIKGNNKLLGNLMMAFDRSQNTIENWMASKDVRLTTPTAVQIIKEHTGLSEEEILEDDDLF